MPLQRSPEPPASKAGARARELILEAAGREFAAKGLHGATSRQICMDAGVNLAAVNYHFGGIDALYLATLIEAHRRVLGAGLLDPEELARLEPTEKLKVVLRQMLGRLALPISGSWEMRLVSLELAAPTFAHEDFVAKAIEPQRRLLKAIIGEFLDRPPEDPLVSRCLLTAIAPGVTLSVINRQAIEASLPDLSDSEGMQRLVDHVERFVLAGLERIRDDAVADRATHKK